MARPACGSGRPPAARAEGVVCLHAARRGDADAGGSPLWLGWMATSSVRALSCFHHPPYSKRGEPTPSAQTAFTEPVYKWPAKARVQAGKAAGRGRAWAWGPDGARRLPEKAGGGGASRADSAALRGEAAGRRPCARGEAPSPARRHPGGLGRAPSAERPRDSGAGLTHEEAEEVEADEQRPLAAALPRVVVERRAAAVLAVRDDRLVVLVVLHGAGCGASLPPREDAPRDSSQTPGLPPRCGCSGRASCGSARAWGAAERVWLRCLLPAAGGGVFCSPCVLLLSSLSQPQTVRQSTGKRAKSPAETCAELRRSGLACACVRARASEWAARALGHLPPPLVT